jgi:peroxiredoxin
LHRKARHFVISHIARSTLRRSSFAWFWRLPALFALAGGSAQAAALDDLNLADYRGKVVLLDFWASWCAPCKASFPWMARMEGKFERRGLVVIAVNVDHDRRLAEEFLRAQQTSFRVYFDPRGQLAERYGVGAMPSSFFIDRDGRIRHAHQGFRAAEREEAERELDELLAERQDVTAGRQGTNRTP